MIRAILAPTALIVLAALPAAAQEVRDTSYAGPGGETVLRIEMIVPARAYDVWRAMTTPEGLVKWLAPVAEIDLRTGGSLAIHVDPEGKIGTPGTLRRRILNVLDRELITYSVELDPGYPDRLRAQSGNLQEIVQLFDLGDGRAKVVSSMVGWGKGAAWEQVLARYREENLQKYRRLMSAVNLRREGPR